MRQRHAPYLDHVSVNVSLALLDELGFRLTPTEGAANHGRVLLDRCYLEVPPPSSSHSRAGLAWFLRPHDLVAAVGMLRDAGVNVCDLAEYVGHDGIWIDVEPVDHLSVSGLPTLTRRVDLDETAWPPPLPAPHPNGVTRITELHIYSQAPDTLGHALEVIGAARPDSETYKYILGDGTTVFVSDAPGAGGGISGLVFGRPDASKLRLELNP